MPAQQYLHLWGTDEQITDTLAVMPNKYNVFAQAGVFSMDGCDGPTGPRTVTTWHTVLNKQYFTDEEMRVVQACARLQPFLLYRLCGEDGQLLHDILQERNYNELRWIKDEYNYLQSRYNTRMYWYPGDIRNALELAYMAVCNLPNYKTMADTAEQLRARLMELETGLDDEVNALVAYVPFLGMHLEHYKSHAGAIGKRNALQAQLVCKSAMHLAMIGLEPDELAHIQRLTA